MISRAFYIFVGLFFLILALTAFLYPDNLSYSPYNVGPSGLSELHRSYILENSSNVTLMLLVGGSCESNFSSYVFSGNTLILAGNYSLVSAYLIKIIKVNVVLAPNLITSNNSYVFNCSIDIVKDNGMRYVFPYPHPIIGGESTLSFEGNSLISCVSYGKGKIIVISTPYLFLNKYMEMMNNTNLIHSLIAQKGLRLIVNPPDSSLLGKIKGWVWNIPLTILGISIKYRKMFHTYIKLMQTGGNS
ncbi:hypothetical protein HS7_15140 [Sulfolobales archaeon HS-7]|nr:hypothetical protein HS7_15140 [Sulfolobales archaeon HS-7]